MDSTIVDVKVPATFVRQWFALKCPGHGSWVGKIRVTWFEDDDGDMMLERVGGDYDPDHTDEHTVVACAEDYERWLAGADIFKEERA